ncbi:hypothetical protein BC941DRAFT_499413 [Chlamydoabsidia padenii]|nr:hypothetical protein BC941DRAFT_499413 [Chlamydoabsidia padenii]
MSSLLDLPNELLCFLFDYADTPLEYYRLCMIHPLLHRIGCSFNIRYSFLYRILVDDTHCQSGSPHKYYIYNSSNKSNRIQQQQQQHNHHYSQTDLASLRHQQDLYRRTLCRFIASSTIPISSVSAIALLELVPTVHFCHFTDYANNNNLKKTLLQVFNRASERHHHRTIHSHSSTLTIPTLVNKTFVATASSCHRHRVMNGVPRRVYYQVTLQQNTAPYQHDIIIPTLKKDTTPYDKPPVAGDTLFALIHDTDTVVAFDQELNCHYGRLWYEDEGILTDRSWTDLLEIQDKLDGTPVPMNYYKAYRGWQPCLLQTLYNCTLKQNVRKGGLKKGDRFDCVFVYEHREDDTICLEFCQRDQQRWVPQGFLLFAEHHIAWSS